MHAGRAGGGLLCASGPCDAAHGAPTAPVASNEIHISDRDALNCAQDCGACYNCADKAKFGGPGALPPRANARRVPLRLRGPLLLHARPDRQAPAGSQSIGARAWQRLARLPPRRACPLTRVLWARARLAGIKKQACINRKCLLMQPRDEDGEKLARKRAKQRAVPPAVHRLSHVDPAGGDSAAFLSSLAIELPRSASSAAGLHSPRSATSSPLCSSADFSFRAIPCDDDDEEEEAAVPPEGRPPPSPEVLQALSEQSLYRLALVDDDEPDGAAPPSQPAMLFAAIRTPTASPQRRFTAAAYRGGAGSKAAAAGGGGGGPRGSALSGVRTTAPPSGAAPAGRGADDAPPAGGAASATAEPPLSPGGRQKRSADERSGAAEEEEEEEEEEEGPLARALRAAFTANIAAKMELDAPPPAQPRLDDLHDEFVLLNAEHRRHADAAMPISVF